MTAPHPFSVHTREKHLSLLHNSLSGYGRQQLTFIFYFPGWANPDPSASPCMLCAPVPSHLSSPPLGSPQFVPTFLALGAKDWTQHYSRNSLVKSNSHPPQLGGHGLANRAQHAIRLHRCNSTLLTPIQHCFLIAIYFYSCNTPTLRIRS